MSDTLDLVKCGMCGKATVVASGSRAVCDACRDEERKLYARVRALLREYGDTRLTIQRIADMLGTDEKKISHLVNCGYFQLVLKSFRSYDE
jgi:hypothetical protein